MVIHKKEHWYDELFDLFADYGLTLTQTEISDIMHKVHEVSERKPEQVIVDAIVMQQVFLEGKLKGIEESMAIVLLDMGTIHGKEASSLIENKRKECFQKLRNIKYQVA